MTEDMRRSARRRLRAFGGRPPRGRAERQRAQSDSLVSDMSAFKAANPSAAFEDFVRWHSPKDWIDGDDARSAATTDGGQTENVRRASRPRCAERTHASRRKRVEDAVGFSSASLCARAKDGALRSDRRGREGVAPPGGTTAAALVGVVARCAVTSALALVAAARAVWSHPDDTKDAIHRASTAISRIFAQTEDRALYARPSKRRRRRAQLAERAVFRAESLLVRLPRAPPSLIHDLLRRARAWESVRETDISRASRLVVSARVVDPSPRASLLARVADLSTPSSIEYAVRERLHARERSPITDFECPRATTSSARRSNLRAVARLNVSSRRHFEILGFRNMDTRV